MSREFHQGAADRQAHYRERSDKHARAPSTIPHFICKACDKPRPMYGRARRPVPHLGRPQWVCAECLPSHPKAAA